MQEHLLLLLLSARDVFQDPGMFSRALCVVVVVRRYDGDAEPYVPRDRWLEPYVSSALRPSRLLCSSYVKPANACDTLALAMCAASSLSVLCTGMRVNVGSKLFVSCEFFSGLGSNPGLILRRSSARQSMAAKNGCALISAAPRAPPPSRLSLQRNDIRTEEHTLARQ